MNNNTNRHADNNISIKILVENKTYCSDILAEHGLSIYIEAAGHKILFDAGATDIVIHNAEKMNVDLSDVDTAVVSHGHYDHTGGFPAFCRINDKAQIYIHRNAFRESYALKDGKLDGANDGIRWTEEDMAAMQDRLVKTDGPVWITEDICVTGSVVKEEGFVPAERFYYKGADGEIAEDDMSHEQCLVIRQPEGIYIFSGCSHTGVIAAVNTAKGLFPGEKTALIAAGMHLYSAPDDIIKKVTEHVAAEDAGCVMPLHCTGMKAVCELQTLLGDRCTVVSAGDSYGRC